MFCQTGFEDEKRSGMFKKWVIRQFVMDWWTGKNFNGQSGRPCGKS